MQLDKIHPEIKEQFICGMDIEFFIENIESSTRGNASSVFRSLIELSLDHVVVFFALGSQTNSVFHDFAFYFDNYPIPEVIVPAFQFTGDHSDMIRRIHYIVNSTDGKTTPTMDITEFFKEEIYDGIVEYAKLRDL